MGDKEKYDIIIIGSGLKELMLAGVLAMKGKNTLLISSSSNYDRNESLLPDALTEIVNKLCFEDANILTPKTVKEFKENIFPEFMKKSNCLYSEFAAIREWMEKVGLNEIFQQDYKRFKSTFYRSGKEGKEGSGEENKISLDADQLLESNVMGMLEKRRYLAFRDYCIEYRQENKSTHKDFNTMDKENTANALYNDFGFDDFAKIYNGQAVGRFSNDNYLEIPAYSLVRRIQVCHNNCAGNAFSPFFMRLYDLGDGRKVFDKMLEFYVASGGRHVKDASSLKIDGTTVTVDGNMYEGKLVITHPSYMGRTDNDAAKVIRRVFIMKNNDQEINDFDGIHHRILGQVFERKYDVCITLLRARNVFACNKNECFIGYVETCCDSDSGIEDALEKMNESLVKIKIDLEKPEFKYIDKKVVTVLKSWAEKDENSKVIETDNWDMCQSFEVICGEVSDLLKTCRKVLYPDEKLLDCTA